MSRKWPAEASAGLGISSRTHPGNRSRTEALGTLLGTFLRERIATGVRPLLRAVCAQNRANKSRLHGEFGW